MKDMFEKIRADKDFNLETLSYQEIFDGLKNGVAQVVSSCSKEEVSAEELILNVDGCSTRYAYAEDGNLYPKIYLNMKGFYSVLLTPFEIEIIESKYGIKNISNSELRECFYNFMLEKFPNAEYDKKFEKYFETSEKMRKNRENMLFL